MQTALIEQPQTSLEALAVDRVEKTPELFTPNDFYGHASVLKRYCGLPSNFQIPAVLPHGVSINHSTWQVELDAPYPSIFAISEEQRLKYADITDKQVHVIGSVMHYAERLIADEINEIRSTADGTVAFPAHSTHHLTADFDQDAFIRSLQDLPEEMKPVRVCLYWRDVQLKRHLKYIDAGFECLTAGHMFDHEFHFRMLRIIASHKNCITNSLGTSSLLAASLGLEAHLIEQDLGIQGTSRFISEHAPKITQPSALNLLETMRIPPGQTRPHQQNWGDIATGREFVHTPEQLHALMMDHSKTGKVVRSQIKATRSWDQEIQGLKAVSDRVQKSGDTVIVPEGTAFQYSNKSRLIEDHETWQLEGIFPNLSGIDHPVIVDCGSDVGYTSIRLAKAWPNAQVYGFEANPLKVKRQFRNMDSFGVNNLALSQKAIWTESGSVAFQTSEENAIPQIDHIPSIRLKDLLREGRVDVLRFNIANATLPVIQDCGADLCNARSLVLNLSNEESQRTEIILLLAELSAIGFRLQVKRVNLLDHSDSELRIVVSAQLQK